MNAGDTGFTKATLISHLLELRTRLLRIAIGMIVAFVPCAIFADELFELLSEPLIAALPAGSSMVATGVMTSFTAPFKLAFYVSIATAMPYLLWEIWGFVAPGLYRGEKRFAVPLVLSSILLFYGGMAFAYFLVFPGIFEFLVATTPTGVKMMTDINEYVGFAMMMFLAFGLSFEVPIVVILMVLTGLIGVDKLTASRGYVIVGIFIVSAVLTPTTDAISQLAMAGPMWILFEVGVIAARMMSRKPVAEKPAS
jgi:sec-independent protein translocase protein TatC